MVVKSVSYSKKQLRSKRSKRNKRTKRSKRTKSTKHSKLTAQRGGSGRPTTVKSESPYDYASPGSSHYDLASPGSSHYDLASPGSSQSPGYASGGPVYDLARPTSNIYGTASKNSVPYETRAVPLFNNLNLNSEPTHQTFKEVRRAADAAAATASPFQRKTSEQLLAAAKGRRAASKGRRQDGSPL